MSTIIFFALGGLDERGKNLYCVEVDKDIFIFEAGTKHPERGILGIDVVIPNLDYIKENKKRIKAIFISKPGHESSEAVSYILKHASIPVYANDLTNFIMKFQLQRLKVRNKDDCFNTIRDKQIIEFDKISVEVFRTTTNYPESFGFAIHTTDGTIVYTGDYIFDSTAFTPFTTDLQHLARISKKEVLLLLSESQSATRRDYTAPNHKIATSIERAVKEAKGRVFLACFEQDFYKIAELFTILRELDRPVAIYGQTLYETIKYMKNNKRLNILLSDIEVKPLNEVKIKENGVIIVTGSGERLYTRLTKMAMDNDEMVDIKDSDTIILASPPSPGKELNHANTLDELARANCKTIALSDKKIWNMNASYEDIKLMTSILNPKYFIPVKGLYKDFVKSTQAAIDAGVVAENAIIVDNGQIVTLVDGKYKPTSSRTIKTTDIYVDGIGIGDIGTVVLNERKQLATEGVLIVGVSVDKSTKEITSLIDTQMRGVIYIQESNPIFKMMQKIIVDIIEKHQRKIIENLYYEVNEIKAEIRSALQIFIKNETGKQPIVLVIINEI